MTNETIKNEKLQRRSEKWYPIFEKIFGFKKRVKILPVDFNKPWWQIIWDQKYSAIFTVLVETLDASFFALVPILIGLIIASNNYVYLAYFILIGLTIKLLGVIQFYVYSLMSTKIICSVSFQANKFFLKVDPISHSTRSSGQIISKVNRGSESYENIIDTFLFEILLVIASVGTNLVALLSFNFKIGLVAILIIVLICFFSIISRFWLAPMMSNKTILAESVETLAQVAHIRSSFASNEQIGVLENKNKKIMATAALEWFSGIMINFVVASFYLLSVLLIGYLLTKSVNNQEISTVIAVGLLVSYISSMSMITRLSWSVQKLSSRITRAKDLFTFIRGFGKQTYPVLEGEAFDQEKILNNL